MVHHLTTALTGPLAELEKHILDAMPAIDVWLRLHFIEHAPGSHFPPLAFVTDCYGRPGDPPNRFFTFGVIARLAMLAAAYELESETTA